MRQGTRLGMALLALAARCAIAQPPATDPPDTPAVQPEESGSAAPGPQAAEPATSTAEKTPSADVPGADADEPAVSAQAPRATRHREKAADVRADNEARELSHRETDQLRQEIGRLKAELAASHAAAASPVEATVAVRPSAGSTQDNTSASVFLGAGHGERPSWVVPAAIAGTVMLGVGFLMGWKTLDGRIRRKYGGLRIY